MVSAWRDAVVVIDDIEVPGERGYEFDEPGAKIGPSSRRDLMDDCPNVRRWSSDTR